jgi:hypothetical protein
MSPLRAGEIDSACRLSGLSRLCMSHIGTKSTLYVASQVDSVCRISSRLCMSQLSKRSTLYVASQGRRGRLCMSPLRSKSTLYVAHQVDSVCRIPSRLGMSHLKWTLYVAAFEEVDSVCRLSQVDSVCRISSRLCMSQLSTLYVAALEEVDSVCRLSGPERSTLHVASQVQVDSVCRISSRLCMSHLKTTPYVASQVDSACRSFRRGRLCMSPLRPRRPLRGELCSKLHLPSEEKSAERGSAECGGRESCGRSHLPSESSAEALLIFEWYSKLHLSGESCIELHLPAEGSRTQRRAKAPLKSRTEVSRGPGRMFPGAAAEAELPRTSESGKP